MARPLKSAITVPMRSVLAATASLRESVRRIVSFATLAASIQDALPISTVVLGRAWVYGSHRIQFGSNCLLYPDVHLETQDSAVLTVGDGCVLSRGVHLVAMAGITLGPGCMIGEYSSLRDANHSRVEGVALRDAGHAARPITLGREVWIGRGVAILGGVTIGDGATVGANAVVTRDVAAGDVVAGVPARSIGKSSSR